MYKAAADNVGHTNKEVRDTSVDLFKEIYKLCNDDATTFTKNLKSLRPIQAKEMKDMLSDLEKAKSSITINIFTGN